MAALGYQLCVYVFVHVCLFCLSVCVSSKWPETMRDPVVDIHSLLSIFCIDLTVLVGEWTKHLVT